MKYIHPKSLTWWSGIFSIILAFLILFGWHEEQVSQVGIVLAALSGGTDASPASLFLLGLGLIGVRDKLERLDV